MTNNNYENAIVHYAELVELRNHAFLGCPDNHFSPDDALEIAEWAHEHLTALREELPEHQIEFSKIDEETLHIREHAIDYFFETLASCK